MDPNEGMRGVVRTPLGMGRIVARIINKDVPTSERSNVRTLIENTTYLICLSRSDFSLEEWLKVSPGNGPCVFRAFAADELIKN